MGLDFQQLRGQIRQYGEGAAQRRREQITQIERANLLLAEHATQLAAARDRVRRVALEFDISVRCALPLDEALNVCFPLLAAPNQATLLAADGSQINPDRHAEVVYGLINTGAIQMCIPSAQPPSLEIRTRLLYEEQLSTPAGVMDEAAVAILRDVAERSLLAELAETAPAPVFTLTDGPIELWGAKDSKAGAADFSTQIQAYLEALERLRLSGAISAGYVDKPGANLFVRTLEILATPEADLPDIKNLHPLNRVSDRDLFEAFLQPGGRSAVFAIQSQSARLYRAMLALHFFYMNVGRPGKPWLSRVEIPAWVANDPPALNQLQAVIMQQCRAMGVRPYPYILHRAHETALVSFEEKDQVTQMLVAELQRRGIPTGDKSYKQQAKERDKRTSFRQ